MLTCGGIWLWSLVAQDNAQRNSVWQSQLQQAMANIQTTLSGQILTEGITSLELHYNFVSELYLGKQSMQSPPLTEFLALFLVAVPRSVAVPVLHRVLEHSHWTSYVTGLIQWH